MVQKYKEFFPYLFPIYPYNGRRERNQQSMQFFVPFFDTFPKLKIILVLYVLYGL